MYQSTNSVVCANPAAASIRSAMFDFVKGLVKLLGKLVTFFMMRGLWETAVCATYCRATRRDRKRISKAEDT